MLFFVYRFFFLPSIFSVRGDELRSSPSVGQKLQPDLGS